MKNLANGDRAVLISVIRTLIANWVNTSEEYKELHEEECQDVVMDFISIGIYVGGACMAVLKHGSEEGPEESWVVPLLEGMPQEEFAPLFGELPFKVIYSALSETDITVPGRSPHEPAFCKAITGFATIDLGGYTFKICDRSSKAEIMIEQWRGETRLQRERDERRQFSRRDPYRDD